MFVSSQAALIGIYGLAAYCGSKYAVRGFAEALAMEVVQDDNSGWYKPLVDLAPMVPAASELLLYSGFE